ncbi:hypothetical protein ACM6L3_12995 [Paenibacillus larvae]
MEPSFLHNYTDSTLQSYSWYNLKHVDYSPGGQRSGRAFSQIRKCWNAY